MVFSFLVLQYFCILPLFFINSSLNEKIYPDSVMANQQTIYLAFGATKYPLGCYLNILLTSAIGGVADCPSHFLVPFPGVPWHSCSLILLDWSVVFFCLQCITPNGLTNVPNRLFLASPQLSKLYLCWFHSTFRIQRVPHRNTAHCLPPLALLLAWELPSLKGCGRILCVCVYKTIFLVPQKISPE